MATPDEMTLELNWHLRRQQGVGSSESPVLALGKLFGRTPLDVYIDKVRPAREILEQEDIPAFRRGHTYEPLAARLYEIQSGMRIFAPHTEEERYRDFQCFDPERPWVFADFDGLCEDGWVLEVKSPMQRNADRMRAEGIEDYYQIQCQHLIHVASVAPNRPGLGPARGPCPGARLVVYEPEAVRVQVYEIPRDEAMIQAILGNAHRFWHEHVVPRVPPSDPVPIQPIKVGRKGGKYTPVEGEGWQQAVAAWQVAREAKAQAEIRYAEAKALIEGAMDAAGLDAVLAPGGWKFSNRLQAGRKGFDRRALEADHPEIDFRQYERPGSPFRSFRGYGPNDVPLEGGDSMDERVLGLREELAALGDREVDADTMFVLWESLRGRADLYERALRAEAEAVRAAAEAAGAAVTRRLTGRG